MAPQQSGPTVDFASAATASLRDLQRRVGLEGWWVLRRNDHEHVVLAAIDDVFGQSAGTVVSWEDSFCRLTLEEHAPPVATDIDQVPCYARARERNGIPARSLVVVPLTAPDGRLIGVLRALGTAVRPDLEQHLPTVRVAGQVLGVLLAHELELAEQVSRTARAEDAAHTDALTGVGNRRAWDAAVTTEEARCARHADQAAVIVVDVNGLKVLNDTRGHHAGDRLLTTAAAVISERMRAADVVARTGGDEFAVLLPRTDVTGARVLARDLERSLAAAGISVSVGVAGRSSRTGVAEAWHQADAAMYDDKAARRAARAAVQDSLRPSARTTTGARGREGSRTALDALPAPRSGEPAVSAVPAQAAGWGTSSAVVAALVQVPAAPPAVGAASDGVIEGLLDLVRRQMGAQVAYVSVFAGGQRRIRNLVSSVELPVAAGDLLSREQGPGWHVAVGDAPAVCADVASEPALAHLPDVRTLGIRSFAGVALRTGEAGTATQEAPREAERGRDAFGSLCVFSQHPQPAWGPRDVAVLQAVTEPLVRLIRAEDARQAAHHQVLDRLDRLDHLDAGAGLQMHFQPVVDLRTGQRVGSEALARFPGSGLRPDEWFATAASVGAGEELELRAVRAALPALRHDGFEGFLALNLSPQTACAPALPRLLGGMPLDRVVVEITEHEQVTDYEQIRLALAPLRARGLRLAVDDVGAGYASLRHVLSLVPDLIKLDISLVRDIHTDPARRALAAALTTFATATGAQVVAEGIETAEELECLRGISVHFGQGYHLARPAPLENAER